MIPRRVRFAILLAFICHGFFILTARYRLSYDAFTHMLFADHYAKNWFSLWETRWYTGFTVVSYPPLAHQLIALFIPILGFESAYALVLWVITTLYPLGIYLFSRIFAGKTASSFAALTSAVLLPIFVAAHIFGQLPFLMATLFALFGAAALAQFLHEGGVHNLALAVSISATTMAMHHATLLIQPFFILALSFKQLNQNNWKNIGLKLLIFFILAIPAGIAVIWPFWQWGMHQQMQIPIDHLSRHNFFTDPFAQVIFFWPFYFPIGIIIPFIFRKWPYNFLGLQMAFCTLFILGLGGTTPFPHLFFGKNWEWLTYDRFAFWATLTLTPFFGILLIRFRRKWKTRFQLKPFPITFQRKYISTLAFFIFTCAAMGSWLTPLLYQVQPKPIDMQPIVNFLRKDGHSQWRYLTFGFGDQFVYLNLLTNATTIDGSYHTARTLPDLRKSGIGQIDTALWTPKGIPALTPIIKKSGELGVRWGFVNRREYIPELRKNGWVFVKLLNDGIQIWENPNAILPQPAKPPQENPFESFSWGIFPMLAFIAMISLSILKIWGLSAEKFIRNAYAFIVGLIPPSLGFWYYKMIGEFNHGQIYFTYDHALFFLSDGLTALAVLFWLAVKINNRKGAQSADSYKELNQRRGGGEVNISRLKYLNWLLATFCCWITLSALWSTDWRTSLYISLHFFLIFALILSLRDWHESWNTVALGLCASLIIQALTGIVEFATQSTAFLKPFNLEWPGILSRSIQGASIVKLADGQTFLRAYGTLPHPNILGGWTLICLAGPITLFLGRKQLKWFALILLTLGVSSLALTFSRSAWLGTLVFFIVLFYKSNFPNRRKVVIAFIATIIAFGSTIIPLHTLFTTRISSPTTDTEKSSINGRIWLVTQALTLIQEHPLMGGGIGSFVIQSAKLEGVSNFIEPVHNIPLLITSDLGVVGLALVLSIIVIIGKQIIEIKTPHTIIAGSVLVGMSLISLFDHYFWTLAPGRLMFGLVLGLWEGQVARNGN